MIRTISSILILLLLAPAALADARTEYGLVRARLVEAVLQQIFPGTTAIDWGEALTLTQNGTRKAVRVADVDYRRDDDGGYTGVLTVEQPSERAPILAKVEAFEPAPGRALAELVAFKASAQFAVSALRRGSLGDAFSLIEEVEDVELSTFTYGEPWPDAFVTYTGVYATPDFYGEIRWDEKLVVEPAVAAANRVPTLLWRNEKTGTHRNDAATVETPDPDTLELVSASSKQVVSRCTDPCLPDGRILLALWWTMTK